MTTRQCGSCTLCCKVMGITAFHKPTGQWCPHCRIGQGCGTYETRPTECRTFMCSWMIDPRIGEEWKPEKSKLVLVADSARNRMTVYLDPGAPNAWKKQPYHGVLQTMAAQGLQHGGQVILMNVGRASLLLPDGLHDLGMLQGANVIEVARTKSPMGDSYAVTVRPSA